MTKWSKLHESCVECKTTERKHKGRGLCVRCFWRARVRDPKIGPLIRKRAKAIRFRNYERHQELSREWVKRNPERRKAICRRHAEKISKWPRGSTVWYELVPDFWIAGTVMDKNSHYALVKFKASEMWLVYSQLRKSDPLKSLRGCE